MVLTVPISVLAMEYLAGESGIISLLLLIALVSVLLRRLALPAARPSGRPNLLLTTSLVKG